MSPRPPRSTHYPSPLPAPSHVAAVLTGGGPDWNVIEVAVE